MGHRLQQTELRGLTGVRGVAALAVVAYHFGVSFTELVPAIGRLAPAWQRGDMGVDLFFILSGFILCYVYRAGRSRLTWADYREFLGFRFARVYPNHLATLAVLGIALLAARAAKLPLTGTYPIRSLPFQLTMTHAWPFAQGWEGKEWNYPSWSISAEWFAYLLVFPACWALASRCRSTRSILFWIFVPIATYAALWYGGVPLRNWKPIVRVTLEFCSGAALYLLHDKSGPFIRICQRGLDGLVVVLAVLLLFTSIWNPWANGVILLAFPCILAGLTAETSLTAKLLAHGLLRWLGEISYAIYMVHALPQKILKVALPTGRFVHSSLAVRFGVIAVYLAVILLFAVVLYYAVELPARRILRRLASPRAKALPMVAVAVPVGQQIG
ncbi:MAG TPA: acyltransferase [Tepidisphaeraceae bacterium]|nr:acyltransferase [Tepidisphaeraceae bacterium]